MKEKLKTIDRSGKITCELMDVAAKFHLSPDEFKNELHVVLSILRDVEVWLKSEIEKKESK